jgi:hypothetical protein
VGDFGKFALLRTLAAEDLRLSVLWYLNLREEKNSDGRHVNYAQLRDCEPYVYSALNNIVEQKTRTIEQIEQSGILATTTSYYAAPLPDPAKALTWQEARQAREKWFDSAISEAANAQLVFLDPDNGLAGERHTKSNRSSLKFAFIDEVKRCADEKRSVVVYQHQPRKRLTEFVADQHDRLKGFGAVWALSFHKGTARIYFVIAAESHEAKLRARSELLLGGCWGKHGCFKLHRL